MSSYQNIASLRKAKMDYYRKQIKRIKNAGTPTEQNMLRVYKQIVEAPQQS